MTTDEPRAGAGAETPLRRDAERNRRKILQAAAALFAEHGLNVGHDQIAKHAGVAVGTVYRRFPDRASLLNELFRDQVDRTAQLATQALTAADPWTGIEQFLTAILEMQADSRGWHELLAGDPHGGELAAYARRHIAPVVRRLVAQAHAAGQLRPGVSERDLALVPLMVGTVIQIGRGIAPRLWRRALAMVLDGLRHPPETPLPGRPASNGQMRQILRGPETPTRLPHRS